MPTATRWPSKAKKRNAGVAHEVDVLQCVARGFSKEQIYHILLENSVLFESANRQWGEYRYQVPGQWQGRFEELRVIGDKKGGMSSIRLGRKPELLARLEAVVGPVRYVRCVRNPFDNIATMSIRAGAIERPTPSEIEEYFSMCDVLRRIEGLIPEDRLLSVRHEDFIASPERSIRALVGHFGLEASDDFVRACASIVHQSPHKSRFDLTWEPSVVQAIQARIEEYGFLARYSFDD